MKSKILSLIVVFIAFLTGFHAVVPYGSRRGSGTIDPAGKEQLEATHAWQALRWSNDQRAYPTGRIPADWREKALVHVAGNNLMKTFSGNSVSRTNVGPTAIGWRVRERRNLEEHQCRRIVVSDERRRGESCPLHHGD